MTGATDIMDRHNRSVAGLGDGGGVIVRILVGKLARQADEHLLACLINLLCRMPGSVSAIALEVPEATLSVVLPDGQGPGPAFDRLRDFAHWAVGDAVPVLRSLQAGPVFTISIDPSAPAPGVDLYVTGAGWIAWIGTAAPRGALADSANPIGPWFAASLAGGEVFKRARGLVRGRFAHQDEGYSLWDGTMGPLAKLRDGPSLYGRTLPPFFLVGAGAVGQGVIALLGASQIQTFVVTIDDDVHDGTNLNRCFVAGTGDVNNPKVDAIARFRSTTKLAGAEFRGTLQQFQLNGPLAEMPAEMQARQAGDRFDLVVSAVDKNTSRWDLQGLRPGLIIGGSTDQLTAKAMTYGARQGDPCLACHNPREEDGARRRELEHQIRGLDDAKARSLLNVLGVGASEIEAVLAYVRNAPICGSLGDQVLGGLATASPREFSVSFVSMAAAVLAFVRLIQAGSFADVAPMRSMMSSVAFRNLSYADDGLARDSACPFCQGAVIPDGPRD